MTLSTTSHHARFTKDILPCEEVLYQILNFNPQASITSERFKEFGRAAERAAKVQQELDSVLFLFMHAQPVHVPVPVVSTSMADEDDEELVQHMELGLRRWCRNITSKLDRCHAGRITLSARSTCRFTYYDFEDLGGILTRSTAAVEHSHELVRVRVNKLPASHIPKPPRAEAIIERLRILRPYCRVVSGTLVVHQSDPQSVIQERTRLGRGVDSVGRGIGRARDWTRSSSGRAAMRGAAITTAAGAGLAALGFGIAKAVSALGTAAVATVAADPAITIGDRVLWGWE